MGIGRMTRAEFDQAYQGLIERRVILKGRHGHEYDRLAAFC